MVITLNIAIYHLAFNEKYRVIVLSRQGTKKKPHMLLKNNTISFSRHLLSSPFSPPFTPSSQAEKKGYLSYDAEWMPLPTLLLQPFFLHHNNKRLTDDDYSVKLIIWITVHPPFLRICFPLLSPCQATIPSLPTIRPIKRGRRN